MIVDTLVGIAPVSMTEKDLFRQLDTARIDVAWVVGGGNSADCALSEEFVNSWAVRHPDRLRSIIWVDPQDAVTVDRLKGRPDGAAPPAAVFFRPGQDAYTVTDAAYAEAFEAVTTLHIPAIIETGVPWRSEALQVAQVAERHPCLNIVMTNGGQINISGLGQYNALLALQRANVFVQTTGVYRQDFLEHVMMQVGDQKMLFASGLPRFDVELEIKRIQWAKVPDNTKTAVLGGNASRLSCR